MTNYLIGSRAIAHHTNIKLSTKSDIDVISDEPIPGFEFHDKSFLNNSIFCTHYSTNDVITINGIDVIPINMKGLGIIKRSHLWRDLKFDRHIAMYHHHLSEHMILNEFDQSILEQRIQLSYKEFDNKYPKLNKTVSEFFDDFVVKKYDHDYLHELVAFNDKPMYTKMQTDPSRAWCEKLLWDTFTYEEKCQCVAEETYVIAIERFLVPTDWKHYTKLAYVKSLHKVCTTLTSGWFRDFAIDNYPYIFNLFDNEKLKNIKNMLK